MTREKPSTRRVHSDVSGNIATRYADDEICLILSNITRVSLLKFFGATSRNDMTDRRLNDAEIYALERFRHLLD
jgi:hypothetical protein